MKVGYFHLDLAEQMGMPTRARARVARMVRSVRDTMPGVEICEWTASADTPLALAVLKAYAAVDGEWLFLDTDVVVRQDVRHVFDEPRFDIALASRDGTLKPEEIGTAFMERMPFNKGAVFSRSRAFWQEAVKVCAGYKPPRQAWMGDQQAMNAVIASRAFTVAILPSTYNYPPKALDERVDDKLILHFKGKRKAWMLAA